MVKTPEVLAIIPARGGSKGLPGKNIYPFAGHPLIAYSVAAAKQAKHVTRTILSTDDERIAEVASHYGAEIPFFRPAELAQDHTPDLPVFQHALAWLAEHEGYKPEIVIQLRPTSPVRPSGIVDKAVELLMENPQADSVRAVVSSGQNPYKMWRIEPDTGFMIPLLEVKGLREPFNAPRQSLPQTFWQIGIIDAFRPERTVALGLMSGKVILPIIVDEAFAVDIDNLESLKRAEWTIRTKPPEMVFPGESQRPFPQKVSLLVLDFDGVITDNRVWVDENGRETVAAYRSDSMGINQLKKFGIKTIVLSTETNPVVAARCKKMKIEALQGIEDKAGTLREYLRKNKVDPAEVIFVGNDINDLPCFPIVGFAAVVADAQPETITQADLVLTRCGGHGAVREICNLILESLGYRPEQR